MIDKTVSGMVGPKDLALAIFLLVFVGCAQGNANGQQNSEPSLAAETHSQVSANTVEPQEQTPSALPQLVAGRTKEIDVVPIRIDPATNAQLRQGERRFGDIFIANDKARTRLPSVAQQKVLDWLSVDSHFDHQIEKRCKPGLALGFYMSMDGNHSDMRMVIDRGCAAVRFFDVEGNFVSSTYYDPSQDLAAKIFEDIDA